MLINVENLKLSLNGVSILQDVQLHVAPNQIYGLIGPNGAGKSTTIAVVLGLYAADSGKLELFGKATEKTSADVRRRIGVMPEHAGFYDWMSACDYLAWHANLYGGPRRAIPELLAQVGLEQAGRCPIGRFSQGMRQRLALARALAHGPELLILDEPTNGLDPRGRREIHDLFLSLAREQGVGILLCTHLLDDVDRLCSRIGIIHHGCTVLEGPLAELLGRHGAGGVYRLRLDNVPDAGAMPKEMEMEDRGNGWWCVRLPTDTNPADLWQRLLEHGWRIREIRAEGGGLEDLYIRMTHAAVESRQEGTV
ncbi:MAG: ABC transporter ATP-binding protein [bacterium]